MAETHIQAVPGPSLLEARGACRGIVAQVFRPTGMGTPRILGLDCDACSLRGTPVATAADWQGLLDRGQLADVRGAFTLAWVDATGALHLARDGAGERSLYYALGSKGVAFASSLRDLLALNAMPRALDAQALANYLSTAYVPGRATLVRDVHALLPGEIVRFDDPKQSREPSRRMFWQLPAELSADSEEALTRALRAALETATARRLLDPSQPVGAFLSGGLDSSLVVALARRLHAAPVHTYSVHFGEGHANELAHSSRVAQHCGTQHTVVELTPQAVLHHFDETVALLDEPNGDPLTVPNALLFREAAHHVDVVLNGEGGDPCFGGPKNLPMLLAELYPAYGAAHSREASFLRSHLKCYDDLDVMLSPRAKAALAEAGPDLAFAQGLGDTRHADLVGRLQAMNILLKGAHHILPKVDALSRPFGIQPRGPLFDRDVVALSMRIPSPLKLHGSIEKYILKQAVRDLLPASILERPKSGMLVPVESWFKGPLLPAARARLLDGLRPFDLFDRNYLERLLAGRLGGLRPRHGVKIWLLLTLESWLRQRDIKVL